MLTNYQPKSALSFNYTILGLKTIKLRDIKMQLLIIWKYWNKLNCTFHGLFQYFHIIKSIEINDNVFTPDQLTAGNTTLTLNQAQPFAELVRIHSAACAWSPARIFWQGFDGNEAWPGLWGLHPPRLWSEGVYLRTLLRRMEGRLLDRFQDRLHFMVAF